MRIKRDEFWHFKNGPNRILAWEIFRNRYILLLSLYTRARARAKIIIREVSIRKVKPQKDAWRMHAAASSSSSSILGLIIAYKKSAKSPLHLRVICSGAQGGGGATERERETIFQLFENSFKQFFVSFQNMRLLADSKQVFSWNSGFDFYQGFVIDSQSWRLDSGSRFWTLHRAIRLHSPENWG